MRKKSEPTPTHATVDIKAGMTLQDRRTAVWMDSNEAKIFHLLPGHIDESILRAPSHHIHRHPKGDCARTHNHPDDQHHFFQELTRSLADADHILVTGPSVTKIRFLRYLHEHDPLVEARIVGLETADHPSDRQFATHVRAYFSESADNAR